MPIQKTLPDRISSEYAVAFRDQFSDMLEHEITRKRVKSIIEEYVGSVDFMQKVREYASMELDSRMFRSTQYWLTTIGTAAITAAIGFIIAKLTA